MRESERSLLGSTRTLLETALGLLQTRIELLATEIQEEKANLLELVFCSATAFMLLSFGLLFLAMTLTVLFWDDHRLLVLGLLTGLFIASGGIALVLSIRKAKLQARIFSASVAELKKDRAALISGSSDEQ